jgi:hypothetical protein
MMTEMCQLILEAAKSFEVTGISNEVDGVSLMKEATKRP